MPVVDVRDAAEPFVLALDIGTSSTRALIFDRRGRALSDSECQIEFDLDTSADGAAEVDPRHLLDLVGQSIDAVLMRQPVEIAAVGISSFWHSLMGLDADGNPTTPIYLWADTRSREDIDAIKRQYDATELWRRTDCFVHSSYWTGKLRWLGRAHPDLVGQTRQWCAFSDYLLRELFGVEGTSVSMASSTALLNATTLTWDDLAIAASGVDPAMLPPVMSQRDSIADMRAPYVQRWPALATCPWFRGFGDGACANVGSGGIGPNRIALTVGTSGAMRMIAPQPVGAAPSAPESLWTYRLDHERAVIGAAISNGGKVVDWLAELMGVSLDDPAMHRAGAMTPDAHGLTILPFLAGERAPIWNDWATGAVVGLKLATTPADLFRAGMESVSYRLGLLYADLSTQASADHQIVANGGAILHSEPWLQMLADIMQHPIVALPPGEEASARGAALLALEAAGLVDSLDAADDPVAYGRIIEPNPAHGDLYRSAMDRQQHLLALLYQNGKPRLDPA